MIQADLWEQVEQELCDFAGICSKIRADEGFQLEVNRMLPKDVVAERQRTRVNHYMRWLQQDMHKLVRRCLSEFTFAASAQPRVSLVSLHADVHCFLKHNGLCTSEIHTKEVVL